MANSILNTQARQDLSALCSQFSHYFQDHYDRYIAIAANGQWIGSDERFWLDKREMQIVADLLSVIERLYEDGAPDEADVADHQSDP